MYTNSYDRFIGDAAVNAKGVLLAEVEMQLFSALRELLQETDLWKSDFSINVVPNKYDYEINSGSNCRIARLFNIYKDGDRNKFRVINAIMDTPGCITLLGNCPLPTEKWQVTVSLYNADTCPNEDCRRMVPPWILDRYYEVLMCGTLSRLYAQPDKPYTNGQLALFKGQQFNSKMGMVRTEITRSNVANAQMWRFPGPRLGSQGRG